MGDIIDFRPKVSEEILREMEEDDKLAEQEAQMIMDCVEDTPCEDPFEKKKREMLTDDFFRMLDKLSH